MTEPSDARLAVLIVTAQFPFPPRSGSAMRAFQLARGLAERHDVTVLSYVTAELRAGVDGLRATCEVEVVDWPLTSFAGKRFRQLRTLFSRAPYASRSLYTERMQQALDALCAARRFDVIQLESSLLCAFRIPPGPRLILNEQNLESEIHRRAGAHETSRVRQIFGAIEARRIERFERTQWRRADGCAVTSEREEPLVHAAAPGTPTAVVPNGVDLEYFQPSETAPLPDTVVFNGRLDYRPNLDAASWLVDEIWPLVLETHPQARLAIVGRGDPRELARLARPSVDVTGEVPDVRPPIASAVVAVVPIRMGGGTRLKVVEGLAMGKAMVSTTLGCEGIAVRDGMHLLVEDEPREFARAISELLSNPQRAAMLGREGRVLMEHEYSWSLADARLEGLYARVLTAAGRTA